MDKFRACANKLEDNNPDRDHRHQVVHKDQIAQSHLRTAAEAYVIGLAYSHYFLFVPMPCHSFMIVCMII